MGTEWAGSEDARVTRESLARTQDVAAEQDRHYPPELTAAELRSFSQGEHWRAWRLLGAHLREHDGVAGTRFSVWAPNAEWVSVIGDFNGWDNSVHRMHLHPDHGIWERFVPGVGEGALYKFELCSRHTGQVLTKIDPFGRHFESRPRTACIVDAAPRHQWNDSDWLRNRPHWHDAPISIYEVHAGSWRRHPDGSFLGYRELADSLVESLRETGFTHVELMPVTEHPLDASWGYQTTGYFAPSSRFGNPDDFRYLVDRLHGAGIGVILDWVPAHFPKDEHALARFDGTALYEHADPARETPEWGTLSFNLSRHEVLSFLVSSAVYWLEHFHLDGLRIDAVASMLYLDYGRSHGDWTRNEYGGNENLEAISFLQVLNRVTHGECPGTFTIAEESTAWPGVTRPAHLGGLGFSMKWNMGWMHDTLTYLRQDPVHRRYHHDHLTFGLLYAFHENFILPLSHDEVVHGKGPLLDRMPGDDWQRFANLRLLYAYMYAYPGKKLLFMGNEVGQPHEWSHEGEIDQGLTGTGYHGGVYRLVCDLNRLYRERRPLHRGDFSASGFEWIDCHDSDQSVISFQRTSGDGLLVVVCNFTPVPRHDYRIGVPRAGYYGEVLNSDSELYGGSGVGNLGGQSASAESWMGQPAMLSLTVPPLGAIYLELKEKGNGIDEDSSGRR